MDTQNQIEEKQEDIPSFSNNHSHTTGSATRDGFARIYGRILYRIRWIVLLVWIIGFGVSIPFAATLSSKLESSIEVPKDTQSGQVGKVLSDTFHQPQSQVLAVFHSDNVLVTEGTYQKELNDFMDQVRRFEHVTTVQQQQPSEDGHTTYIIISFDQEKQSVTKLLPDFRKIVPGTGPAQVLLTGDPAVGQDLLIAVENDLKQAEIVALPITLVILVIVFGTLVTAAMPILLALFAVPVALALLTIVNHFIPLNFFVLNIATIIGLGISIDYSLFIIRRYREELALGIPKEEAIGHTIATAGEAILFSGLTVMIGFSGLYLLKTPIMSAIAIGGAITVGCAVLAALTLQPAILTLLGERVNSLRVPILWKLTLIHADQDVQKGFWYRLAQAQMRFPLVFIIIVLAIVGIMASPIRDINIGSTGVNSLPKTSESRQALDILHASYPTFSENTITIVAHTPDGTNIMTADNLAKVDNLSQWVYTQSHITSVTSLTRFPVPTNQQSLSLDQLTYLYSTGGYKQQSSLIQLVDATTRGDTTIIRATSDLGIDSKESQNLIKILRDKHDKSDSNLEILVGGTQAQSLDLNNILYGNFPLVVLFILATSYVLLLIMLRSVLLPLKALIMTGLSVSAAFGTVIFIFQYGHFSDLLHFTSNGFIENMIPILLFCVLFGLSMDYEVFLVSRIREEWLKTGDNRTAVANGLERTGGVITNAALLFIVIAGAFAFTSISETQEIGVGLAVAIFVDAMLIRTLLASSVMRLMGSASWWFPGRRLKK
jgi:RND superfamily putative drug exporter